MSIRINPITLANIKYSARQHMQGGGNVTYYPDKIINDLLWVVETLEYDVELRDAEIEKLSKIVYPVGVVND